MATAGFLKTRIAFWYHQALKGYLLVIQNKLQNKSKRKLPSFSVS